ncbi:grasp-with-spasm system SPASM domain peptide maturase [Taibaiella chishuiensis]|uniref:SPASM domain peptide maturase of grasp-with-spasm system n=1 Tax=Taibaiella chishuiensis TaxID=1434707 RepID=A0A2P8D8R0_9BACT|nr:grasp-with-spasm system SPASM domain peptide maturase [Taibaiella chishuiensis]PSK93577.1 SPASM domain peptide maturase of grasp-with-spasm system [Taibaiella chishuiensis]
MRYFNLYSNILITKGANRILISDLQRNNSELQSLELYDIIEALKSHAIETLMGFYDEDSKPIVGQYLDFLVDKEYGFISTGDRDHSFPPLSLEYKDAGLVSDIFIACRDLARPRQLAPSIGNLAIKHMVIYCEQELAVADFLDLEISFSDSSVESIEIFAPCHAGINENYLQQLSEGARRIYSLVFYKCTTIQPETGDRYKFKVVFTSRHLKINACGKVDLKYFNTHLPKVLEAINHNSCLHKKIGIDINGDIRNCPAMPQRFGNIRDCSLEEALNHKAFKNYWNLTKDHIAVCKDCEFRNICTDCRAYTERTHINEAGLDNSKPLKCGYSPYTNQWEKWSENPLKQKAIRHYGLQELIKNEEA